MRRLDEETNHYLDLMLAEKARLIKEKEILMGDIDRIDTEIRQHYTQKRIAEKLDLDQATVSKYIANKNQRKSNERLRD